MEQDLLKLRVQQTNPYHVAGKVTKSVGLVFEAHLPGASIGSLCRIHSAGRDPIDAEVVGFRDRRVILMPYATVEGLNTESLVTLERSSSEVLVGNELLGRVLDARGMPLDGKPLTLETRVEARPLYAKPIDALKRKVIREPLDLGIRVLNGLLTTGKGQRMGIMAGSGVGKSVLLGMMAKHTSASVNVIALIGERGREVREFIERDLGEEGLARSVVIVATSDQSPLLRLRGAFLATAVAEYFRDQGQDVLLMMDSVTRFCMAQREIGLSMGEPPTSKGYTPSVFSMLPKLLERAGASDGDGSITGLYTVLVEGDDMDEPIADAARSILDGHIVLSRRLAERNHYPAIDVLQSASRVMTSVVSAEHRKWAGQIKEWMAVHRQNEDLISIGAYVKGANPQLDQAIAVQDRIRNFLRQDVGDRANLTDTEAQMHAITRAGDAFARG